MSDIKKVLLCERSFNGHRRVYYTFLSNIENLDIVEYCPEKVGNPNEYYEYKENNSLIGYFKWIRNINRIVKKHNVDVVHILDGDSIMKYCGLFFKSLNCKKLIITFHHYFNSNIKHFCYKMMFRSSNAVAVVHTLNIKTSLQKIINNNVELCYYPSFDYDNLCKINPLIAKSVWKCPSDEITIGIIGGLSSYKNILSFLRCMNNIDHKTYNYHLLICGRCIDVSEDEIKNAVSNISKFTTLFLGKMSDEEYRNAIVASDIIFSIYDKSFDGASGPLIDGVASKKMIIGCSHGSTGNIVLNYKLGYICDSDNMSDIVKTTKKAISTYNSFKYCIDSNQYRKLISPKSFVDNYFKIYNK